MNMQRNVRRIRPHPGPQTQALASAADITLYGGAAGGGKTYALLLGALRNVSTNGYAAIIFRRIAAAASKPGGLFHQARQLYTQLKGNGNRVTNTWKFPALGGGEIGFAHCQHETDIEAHQGAEYAYIGFDELTHFTPYQFWYAVSRNRTSCGVRPRVLATLNPDPDSWVYELVSWWIGEDGYPIPERAGVLRWIVRAEDDTVQHFASLEDADAFARTLSISGDDDDSLTMSITFVPSRYTDNPSLSKDYPSRLAMQNRQRAEELLRGRWIRDVSKVIFLDIEAKCLRAEPVAHGRVIVAVDPSGGKRHAQGIVVLRATMEGQTPRAEVLYSEHRRGDLPSLPGYVADLCERFGASRIVTDTWSLATTQAMQSIHGVQVHAIKGGDRNMNVWAHNAAQMIDAGNLHIPRGHDLLVGDIYRIKRGSAPDTVDLLEWQTPDGETSHCDAADCMLRALTIIPEACRVKDTTVRVHGQRRKADVRNMLNY